MITMNQSIENQLFPIKETGTDRMCFEDEAGFSAIVQHHSAKLLTIVTYITRNRQTAEDIVQETFLRLWEKRVTITPDNLGGWLYRVATNLAMGHLKRESFKTRVYASLRTSQQEFATEVEERLVQKETRVVFNKIYARLPEQQQAVYHLSKVDGLTRDEIAHHLKISPHTVKNHLSRAVQFIKENIGGVTLFFLFFVFNNIFFNRTSTKAASDSLYTIQQQANSKPIFPLKSGVSELMKLKLK
ncbi:sigma-70 family RNA polymerase sigma factor [Chitinophaga ginsengisegetis]|uniref:RNA polymerase sigma factor n=1 Tax=Chitinophaga ginsengisegetis TaxID=393003 RepID=UPI0034182D61